MEPKPTWPNWTTALALWAIRSSSPRMRGDGNLARSWNWAGTANPAGKLTDSFIPWMPTLSQTTACWWPNTRPIKSPNAPSKATSSGKKMCKCLCAVSRLPNGNTFIACQNQILELDRTGKEVVSIGRPTHDVMAAQKLRNGQIVVLTNTGALIRMDATGKETSSQTLHAMQILGGSIDVLPNGHVLIPQYRTSKVVEYDAEGKIAWEASVIRPISAYRLPNGQTLVGTLNQSKIIELDRAGKQVSEKQAEGRIMKVRRR